MEGDLPPFTGKQLRDANSRGGLNLVCWESRARPEYEAHGELLQRYMMCGLHSGASGLSLERSDREPTRESRSARLCAQDWRLLWDAMAGHYTSNLGKDLSEIVSHPHVVGLTRDLEPKRQGDWAGSWVGALFDYHPPRLGFNRSEQRMLSCALPGATDEHLAETLETSLPVVKKMWVSIYRRVEDCLPELIADPLPSDIPASGRGREKRRRLLAYLREHPEELRPVSRKLLR